ncbi:MAG: insulinase family protein [Lachnospiraceae bacterium]|nr:insulinase family protein [Lachnospiraceae bacterium]
MRDLGTLQNEAYERLYGRRLPAYQSDGLVLRHKKSGARIVLMANDDPNKVFAIAFRTTPKDDTGVPHIIEHSVLAGSEKYPVKDPFMELSKGSLKTFLNAFTGADVTMYPVASCNEKDFRNLVDVYMDSVLHPLIYKREEIFRQEGWRYEMESTDDELTLNGVVYSEMKGAYSDPEAGLEMELYRTLFPDVTYGVESGGDPKHIPELTYEDFLAFHHTYYSPANSYIYLYGDMDMQYMLTYLDREYLSKYDIIPVDSEIGLQSPTGFKRVDMTYSVAEDEDTNDKAYLIYGAKLFDGPDVKKTIAWDILSTILFSIPGAPVKKALLDAGIGNDVSGSFRGDQRQPILSVTARETDPGKADEFLRIIRETVADVATKGLNKKSIEAALNRAEFSFLEADFGGYPKGLFVAMNSVSTFFYDDKAAFDGLDRGHFYQELHRDLENGYFEVLLQEYLNSDSSAMIVMTPEPGLAAKHEKELAAKLAERRAQMSQEELEELVNKTKALKEYQSRVETEEELSCIPRLTREEIGRKQQPVPYTVEKTADGIPLVHVDKFTGGITYLQMRFDTTDVPEEELPYLGLLSDIYLGMDTEHFSYKDLQDEMNYYAGGINGYLESTPVKGDVGAMKSFFTIAVKVLDGKLDKGIDLAWEGIGRMKLEDADRLHEIMAELAVRLPASMESRGHQTARELAYSYFSPASRYTYLSCGEAYYAKLREWLADFDNVKEELFAHLRRMRAHVFTMANLTLGVTADVSGFTKAGVAFATIPGLLKELPEEAPIAEMKALPWKGGYALTKKNEVLTYAGSVQYNCVAGNFRAAGFSYNGAYAVLNHILTDDYLWNRIRVLGGAYGAMQGFGYLSGDAFFVTYRDPNCRESFKTIEETAEYVANLALSENEITKYVIGTISGMDVPITPASILGTAMGRYFTGVTAEEWQKIRDDILKVTNDDLKVLAPMIDAVVKQGYRTALATETVAGECKDLFMTSRGLRG